MAAVSSILMILCFVILVVTLSQTINCTLSTNDFVLIATDLVANFVFLQASLWPSFPLVVDQSTIGEVLCLLGVFIVKLDYLDFQ